MAWVLLRFGTEHSLEFHMEAHPRHTNIQYQAELDALRERLQTMGVMVEEQIVRAVESLVDRNSEVAR